MRLCFAILAELFVTELVLACSINITVSVVPRESDASYYIAAGNKRLPCDETSVGCEAYTYEDLPRSITLVIDAIGYRVWRRSFLDQACKDGKLELKIGQVTLIPSDLPRVEQIIRSVGDDGSRRFEIVMSNRQQKEVLLKRIRIDARREVRNGFVCAMPSPVYFQLGGKLTLAAGGQTAIVNGSFTELSRGQNYSVAMSGKIDSDECSHRDRLVLEMPIAITLPSHEYTSVVLTLPKEFELRGPAELATIGGFGIFGFTFISDDPDAGRIAGTYVDEHEKPRISRAD